MCLCQIMQKFFHDFFSHLSFSTTPNNHFPWSTPKIFKGSSLSFAELIHFFSSKIFSFHDLEPKHCGYLSWSHHGVLQRDLECSVSPHLQLCVTSGKPFNISEPQGFLFVCFDLFSSGFTKWEIKTILPLHSLQKLVINILDLKAYPLLPSYFLLFSSSTT